MMEQRLTWIWAIMSVSLHCNFHAPIMFTTGQVYLEVIENERQGKYLGKTVQVVPHITDEIKRRIHLAARDADLLLGEIGVNGGGYRIRSFFGVDSSICFRCGPGKCFTYPFGFDSLSMVRQASLNPNRPNTLSRSCVPLGCFPTLSSVVAINS